MIKAGKRTNTVCLQPVFEVLEAKSNEAAKILGEIDVLVNNAEADYPSPLEVE
jgi:hypothetical protein